MKDFFSVSSNKSGFELFDKCHISWLFGILIFTALCILIYKFFGEKTQKVLSIVIASGLILTEIFRQTVLFVIGESSVGYLPFHLCSINMFVCLFDSFKSTKFTQEILYAVCLPGTVMALLFPNWTSLPFGNFIHITSFVIHGLLFVYPMVLLCNKKIKPDIKQLPKVFLVLLAVAVAMYFFNKAFDTNFWFLNGAGNGNPLTFFEKKLGNPGYFLAFPVLAAVIWLAMYLPWVISNKLAKKNDLI